MAEVIVFLLVRAAFDNTIYDIAKLLSSKQTFC